MPVITAFVDACRAELGRESVDPSIKAGMQGRPLFYASENGVSIGTKDDAVRHSVSGDALFESLQKQSKGKK